MISCWSLTGQKGEEIQIFNIVETTVRLEERTYHPLSRNRIALRKELGPE